MLRKFSQIPSLITHKSSLPSLLLLNLESHLLWLTTGDSRLPVDDCRTNIAPPETTDAEDCDGESLMDRRHLSWTDETEDCLIDKLLEEKLKGQKFSRSFTKTTY